MRYIGMPWGMWALFERSFREKLVTVLGLDEEKAVKVTAKAKSKYKELIASLPEFEKGDRFKMNIVSCAMFAAFCLNIDPLPSVDKMTSFYNDAMMISAMKWFCRQSGKKKFTGKDIESLRSTADFKAADRNPYSWNMEFREYEDGSGYEARFTKCGICTLMGELGLKDVVPAMCQLDYTMSDAGGASTFIRECTLAKGDEYCDCGYKKKMKA